MRKYILLITVLICLISLLPTPYSLLHSQTIVSVTPNYVKNGDSLNIYIAGINTKFLNANNGISFEFYDFFGDFINVKSFGIISDDTIVLNITVPRNATKGFKDLIIYDITDPGNPQTYGKHNAIFTDNPSGDYAGILDVSPDIWETDQMIDMTVTGMNSDFNSFKGDPPSGYLYFTDDYNNNNSIIIDEIKVLSKDSMILTLLISQFAKQGYYHLVAMDESIIKGDTFDNFYGKQNAIYITAPLNPEIISVNPAYGVINQKSITVTIKGRNTHFSKSHFDKSDKLSFENQYDATIKDVVINTINVINDTALSVNFSFYGANGYRDLVIKDSVSNFMNYGMVNAFWIGPYMTSITPDTSSTDRIVAVDLTCVNTNFNSKNKILVWLSNYEEYNSNINATEVLVKNQLQLSAKFVIPKSAHEGLWDVYIADTANGVLYRNQFFQIGRVASVPQFSILNSQFSILKTYPNPFNNDLYLEYYPEKHSLVSIDIFDITGKMVYSRSLGYRDKGYNKEKLNAEKINIDKGIYFLRLVVGNKFYMSKIIKL